MYSLKAKVHYSIDIFLRVARPDAECEPWHYIGRLDPALHLNVGWNIPQDIVSGLQSHN